MSRYFIVGGLIVVLLSLVGFGVWMFSLPATATIADKEEIATSEMQAMLASLKSPKRGRPIVAVVGINDATETTDYIVPTGILRRANVADVFMLATAQGPVKLYPALTVEADATIATFDAQNPAGADYVIVPAMSRDDDPTVLTWLHEQARKGAIIIGVCAGAKIVAEAGLLDNKRATTHWYYVKVMLEKHPSISYVANRRVVVDHGAATSTGISASMPMMLLLIEAIAGRQKAETVANDLAVLSWDARHASAAFQLTRSFTTTILGNVLAFWNRESIGVPLQPGMDEVSLAFVADAWSRTYRSQAVSLADMSNPVETRNGIRVIPEKMTADWPEVQYIETLSDQPPARALDQVLSAIAERYGTRTSDVVAMQLEYPQHMPSMNDVTSSATK
ncbi:DJ-1/PfpI family protein [Bordetella genomosp. 4]|uniref:DJ-1/PfpI family protein n=1 Tax=Bordetella genomosp. 4 TaxID=463044 RepID=UPI000B9E061B|nr:DJ-1/PfpI family protein [Bordetella genomosp. 4]OZI43219.1 transcriptional regulator [Bordetella genomosp. 4]